MAEKKRKTDRGEHGGRRHNSDFSRVLRGPHYWISVKTKDGRVVRIPVEGNRRKAAGKRKASKATVRPFKGTQGRDVVYRAKGAGGTAAAASLREQAAAARAARLARIPQYDLQKTPQQRLRHAQRIRAARHVISRGPRPIQAVSDKQRRYAEDLRAREIIAWTRQEKAGRDDIRNKNLRRFWKKDMRQIGLIKKAHEYKKTSARSIIDYANR